VPIHTPVRLACSVLVAATLANSSPAFAQSTQASPSAAAAQAPADDDAALVLAEPDYRLVGLPTTLRLPVHKGNFQLTHRFNGNLERGSFSENASNLFGLDQGAVVGFEYRFGVMRHLQAAVYRTAIDKTFQFYGKYDAITQGAAPFSLSGLASVEGTNNFQDEYSPALGVVASRLVGDRLAMYAAPIWVHNTAAILDVDRDTFFVGLGARLRLMSSVYVVGDVSPRAGGYSPQEPAYAFGIEKRYGGHLFQLNFGNSQGTTFGQLARGGVPDSLFMGFNLARKFF
jgi:uncharacterized beta barrel domain-containing protein DUF5777